MSKYKQFWIFVVVGGEPFRIQIKGNPAQRHDGNRSIIRALITDEMAKDVEVELASHGGTVTLSNSPREEKEAKDQRQNLLKIMGDNPAFPCEQCPSCSWFDPYLTGLCGAGRSYTSREKWDDVVFTEQMKDAKYKQDFDGCPIPLN
jgi:hypothetical protein